MKKLLVIILLGVLVIQMCPIQSFADEEAVVEKFKAYQNQIKNPWIAIGLSSVFPSLGHLYAGDWGRGLLFLLADVSGAYLFCGQNSADISSQAGMALLSVSKIWEVMDAYQIVKIGNIQLADKLGLNSINDTALSEGTLLSVIKSFIHENQQITNGVGLGNTFLGVISKDGLDYPRNIYGMNTSLGYSHTLVYGGQPSIDEVVVAYNQVKSSKSEEEIIKEVLIEIIKNKMNKSNFTYFEYGTSLLALPINYYWGQIITISDSSRIKWGVGLPTLLSLGFSYDF